MSTSGTYTVKLTASSSDAVTTTKTTSLVVEATPTPSITASGATSFCQGGNVILTGSSGYQGYSWNTNSSTSSITVTDSNEYFLTVTSASGCVGSTSVIIDVNALPTATVSNLTNTFDFCDGSSVVLDAPTGASGYQWYKDGVLLAGATSGSYSATGSGSYAVSVMNADGCSSLSAAQTVTKNVNPTAIISAGSALSFCDGGSVTLTGPSNMSYLWSDASTSQSLVLSSSGQVGLTITDANGCSATASTVDVNVYSVPTLAVTAASSTSICQGESVTLQASGGFSSYAWSSGASNQNLIVNAAGSYSVTGTTSDGCTTTSSAQSVTVNALPTAIVTNSGSNVLCSGGSATLSAPSAMSSYLWSDGSTTQSITVASSGNYSVTVTNADGCSVTSAASSITTSQIITPSIASSSSTTICSGDAVTLSVPSGYASYLWSNGSTTSSTSASTAGNYSVTVTNTDGCSVTTTATAVTVNALPTATVSNLTNTFDFCDGSSVVLDAPTGASGYQWYKDGVLLAGATSGSYSATGSGSYAVSVMNADGCSSLSAAQTVTKNVNPTAIISAGSALSFCDGGSVTLTGPSNMSYLWSDASTSQSLVLSSSGQVGLTITDANGCSATASTVDVNVYSVPTLAVTAASSTSICQGESVTLQASGGFSSYAWSSGASNQNLIVNAAGSYSVTGTTSDGCTTTSSAQSVTVNALPTAIVTNSGSNVLCSGGSATLSAPSAMSSYLWSDGSTTQSITVASSGNYSVTVTNADGCSVTSAASSITTSQIITPSIASSSSTTICSGDAVTLSVPSGYASYLWSNGSTTSSTSASTAGNYSVTVTNTDGCSVTTTATAVTVNALPTATVSNLTNTFDFCDGSSVVLDAPTGASGYQWYKDGVLLAGATSGSYSATGSGSYAVSVMNADGCSSLSAAQTVTKNVNPTAIVTNNGASLLCSGLTTTLSAPTGMTYLWSNGDTTQTITISTSGSYDVTVTNTSGCSATSGSTLITTSQVTVPTVVASGVTEFCEGGDVILAIPSGFASYTWNTGSGFSQLTATQSGSYFATVSNTDGCTVNSDTVIVTVFPTPLTPSISYAANDTVMVSSIADGNQWYFNGIMITGETGTTLRPVNLGNYSVRIIDSNSCEGDMSAMQFYNSIGIVDNLASQVNLYPNPSNGLVTLELGAIDVLSIKIYDAKGRLLNELNSCPGNCRIDLGAFEDGMYQLVLMTTQGQTVTKAVVLQK